MWPRPIYEFCPVFQCSNFIWVEFVYCSIVVLRKLCNATHPSQFYVHLWCAFRCNMGALKWTVQDINSCESSQREKRRWWHNRNHSHNIDINSKSQSQKRQVLVQHIFSYIRSSAFVHRCGFYTIAVPLLRRLHVPSLDVCFYFDFFYYYSIWFDLAWWIPIDSVVVVNINGNFPMFILFDEFQRTKKRKY